MAHILKEFSKHCGVKSGKPILSNFFFPIPFKDYITIDTSNCTNDSEYLYFKEFIDAFNALKKYDIKIINICGKNKIENADMLIDQLSSKQCNYLVKNSKLHICVDSATGHIASHYKTPCVVLFSHSHPKLSMPYWNPKTTVCIEPKYKNNKPNYFPHKDNSVVNTIYPDQIISAVRDLTNFIRSSDFKTIYIGKYFKEKILNLIPNFHHELPILKGRVINLRFDKHSDLENLQKWLISNKCGIVTNEEINLRILNSFKKNIAMLIFEFDESSNYSEEYFIALKTIGIKFKIYVKNCSKERYGQIKNDLFDFPVSYLDEPSELPFEFNSKYKFASNNMWVSEGNMYKSFYNAKKLDNTLNISNDEDFIKELENFYIYE